MYSYFILALTNAIATQWQTRWYGFSLVPSVLCSAQEYL